MVALLRLALLVFAAAIVAHGQDNGLAISLRAPSARQDSPLAVEVTFDSRGAGIIEGTLEFRFLDARAEPRIHRTNEIAIKPGRSTQRMLLPPVHLTGGSLEVQVLFHGKKGTQDFGKRPLAVWNSRMPPLRAGVCLGGNGFTESGREMWRSLQLRTYADGTRETPPDVLPSWIEPEDAPTHVLAWCAYDLVIIGGPGFRAMRGKSLASLAHWVRAGGSLLVIADGPVNEPQLAFLNELTGDGPDRFSAGESGLLHVPAGLQVGLRVDFGRAVVLPEFGQSPAQWETPEWRVAVAFLWKVRLDLIPRMMHEGKLRATGMDDYGRRRNAPWENRSLLQMDLSALQKASLPERITPVPFAIVALVFLAFVLLIGPVDRVLLRRLRMTRWTWVVFPLVCLGFTWFMVALANAHLGREDHKGIFRIRDVGSDGSVLRETKIETLFSGRTHERVTRLVSATVQDITDDRIGRSGAADTTGSLLAGYDYRQEVQQWDPRMTVTRSFEQTPDDSGLDWSAIPKERPLQKEWPGIRRKLDPGSKSTLWFHAGRSSEDPRPSNYETLCGGVAPVELRDFLSQSSPRPGAPLDDLAVMDSEDPGAWLVVAMQRTGPYEVNVWRRLFRWPRP